MKYIFLFVNPTSGGNRASIFTELGVNEIIFHKPHKCHLYIYNMLDGEEGKKPGFLHLSSVINSPRELENEDSPKNGTHSNGKKLENNSGGNNGGSPNESNNANLENFQGDKNNNRKALVSTERISKDSNCNYNSSGNSKSNDNSSYNAENKIMTCNESNIENKDIFVYLLVAGGDGTLNWVLKEVEFYDINHNKFAVGVIPFGTGNDFAKAFGWKKINGIFTHTFLFNILKKIVDQTFKSKIEKHDYWNIEIVLNDDGYFNKINSKTKKKETLTENNETVRKLKLCMSNYFSIGIGSRIGRGFERHRKKSAFLNKLIYVLEGLKKVSFKRNIPVNLIIDKMVTGKNYDDVIFTTDNNDEYPSLKKAVSIICINIPSYASGNDIWNYTHKIGLKLPKNLTSDQKQVYEDLKKAQQSVGDGILEFVIYQSGIDIGLEFTVKGRAYRVHQGLGPWKICFKEKLNSVYFQVDGEYYRMTLPQHVSIEHYKKINALKNII
ncbi:diacylglycerol kinase [Plasmodium brasilianum]|uniref:Diacylglycerol kinase n=1 Tax=Plasmodium brasilianum TaxID=5824 RepID=A0ACB9Y4K4_PLABR|nr:diacylglycerol kinase [Plasmodium brasilianum]